MVDSKLSFLYFFEDFTPLFGFLLFLGPFTHFLVFNLRAFNFSYYLMFINFLSSLIAIIHNDWFVGLLSVWLFYARYGFYHKSMVGGYMIGFKDDSSIVRCLVISLILVPLYIVFMDSELSIKLGDLDITASVQAFQTGVLFWGTFIGLLAMLILSDYDYMLYKSFRNVHMNGGYFAFMQVAFVVLCFLSMYFGSVLDISCMKNIGGTFMVLWFMDIQRVITFHIGLRNLTITSGLVLANLVGLIYYMRHFPEYFIF